MDVPPIHVEVQAVAVNASHRLRSLRLWKRRTRHTRLELLKALNDPIICMRGDWMSARIAEEPAWETIFPSREDWLYNRTVYQALENAGIPTGQKPEGCLEQVSGKIRKKEDYARRDGEDNGYFNVSP
uniref:Uncharacterized protein n=1 Tax=Trichogramma kaykai TaxID=54128 RepID=A0ABD2XQ62_9HYME